MLLVLALTGNMIHEALGGNPSIVNYVMFVAVFSMLSLLYLIPATISEGFQFHSMLPVGIDALNVLFTFIGGVALAAYLGANNCSDSVSASLLQLPRRHPDPLQNYTKSNLVTAGSDDNMKRCREAQASTAFLWFAFATFTASLGFGFLNRGSSSVNMRVGGGGIRRGPSMTQTSRV